MTALLAVAPALAPGKAAPYVTGAYVAFVALLLVYVAIMARRLAQTERELVELNRDLAARDHDDLPAAREPEAVA